MIKEFNSFHDRMPPFDFENDPLNGHLFSLTGQEWRDLRVKMSPLFTSGKLKLMFPMIRNCVLVMESYMDKNVKNGSNIFDMRDLLARFTTNVISSVAFGIDNDCINERDNIFRKMGLRIFEPTTKQSFIEFLSIVLPKLLINFKVKTVPQDLEDFFISIVKQTIDYRQQNNIVDRKDFMQLMIQLKNQGYLTADKDDDGNEIGRETKIQKLSFNQIAAQAFLFFAAGFETSSSTMNFTLFELARNPHIQQKVYDEIEKVLQSKNISEVTYEMMNEMKYTECCIDEALRKYPIVPFLSREVIKDHTFTGTNIVIEKGTPVVIPVWGLHRDPKIYENPAEFKPERFLNSSNGG